MEHLRLTIRETSLRPTLAALNLLMDFMERQSNTISSVLARHAISEGMLSVKVVNSMKIEYHPIGRAFMLSPPARHPDESWLAHYTRELLVKA